MSNFYQSAFYQNCFSLPSTIIKTVRYNCSGLECEGQVKALATLIKTGSICFDVGGAYGRYAFPLSSIVGPQGRIYSFEPGGYSCKVLKFVKFFFGLHNVVIIKKVVADRAGSIELCLPQAGSFREKVDMLTLDDFVKQENPPRVDLIKCDTGGSELSVFQGALGVINRSKPIVLTEIDADKMARYGQKPSDMLDFFRIWNYRLMVWDKEAFIPLSGADKPGKYFFIPETIRI